MNGKYNQQNIQKQDMLCKLRIVLKDTIDNYIGIDDKNKNNELNERSGDPRIRRQIYVESDDDVEPIEQESRQRQRQRHGQNDKNKSNKKSIINPIIKHLILASDNDFENCLSKLEQFLYSLQSIDNQNEDIRKNKKDSKRNSNKTQNKRNKDDSDNGSDGDDDDDDDENMSQSNNNGNENDDNNDNDNERDDNDNNNENEDNENENDDTNMNDSSNNDTQCEEDEEEEEEDSDINDLKSNSDDNNEDENENDDENENENENQNNYDENNNFDKMRNDLNCLTNRQMISKQFNQSLLDNCQNLVSSKHCQFLYEMSNALMLLFYLINTYPSVRYMFNKRQNNNSNINHSNMSNSNNNNRNRNNQNDNDKDSNINYRIEFDSEIALCDKILTCSTQMGLLVIELSKVCHCGLNSSLFVFCLFFCF